MAKTAAEILALLCQNSVEVIDKGELEARLAASLKEKKPLRVKAGFDPSAPDIHLGHTVLLRKLRQFQDLGHKVIFIIGDYTAMVGDPTGQSKTRPLLSKEQIEDNAKTYQDQAFKILDKNPEKIEIVRNSQWLDGPDMFRILFQKIAAMVNIDQLLEREDFDKRRRAHRPIVVRELLYPMLQGYDSVMVKADIELGGTDQKFNLLMGRDLQYQFAQKPQIVITMPLLVGLDGTIKMSKSLGNYVAVTDSPRDMFGKIMSLPDALMPLYFSLLTSEWDEATGSGVRSDPRSAKVKLAKNIVVQYYGEKIADKEAAEFDRVFRDKQSPESPEEIKLSSKTLWIVELLKEVHSAKTGQEARRLIEHGAVELDGIKIKDPKAEVSISSGSLLKVGKKKYFKLIV